MTPRSRRESADDLERRLSKHGEAALCYEGQRRRPTTHLVKRLIAQRDRHPPKLSDLGTRHSVHALYRDEEKLEEVVPCIGNTMRATVDDENLLERAIIRDRTIETILVGFGTVPDAQGRIPAMMDTPGHYLVEHSLHAAAILLAVVPDAPIGALVATLLHDYYEDVVLQINRPSRTQTREIILTKTERGVFQYLAEDLSRSSAREVRAGLEAVKRLTLWPTHDYLRNIEDIVEESAGNQQQGIAYALMAKLADKIGAVQTLSPYGNHKKQKIYGKTWKVINIARTFLNEHKDSPYAQQIQALIYQAAITMRKSINGELETLRADAASLQGLEPNEYALRGKLGNNARRLNDYIRSGGLKNIDINEGANPQHDDFNRTIYKAIVIGSKLDDETIDISPALLMGRTPEEARARLKTEQEQFRKELPDRKIPEYLQGLVAWDKETLEQFTTPHELQKGFDRLERRLLILERMATKYAIDSGYALPNRL